MPEDRYIQMLKVSLPYMHSPMRETCKNCVRFYELRQAMQRLDEEEESLEACSRDQKTDPLSAVAKSIREYCTPREMETLDMISNMLQMMRLYRDYDSEGDD